MNKLTYILQWNLNGIKTRQRLGELQRLLTNYEPVCICLQHIGHYDTNIKNYQLASQSLKTNDELGTAIYVHNRVIFDKIQITNSELQHSATTIHLENNKKITICNIYNQPLYNYNITNIKNILTPLTEPILLLGDFNAHSPLWDENCSEADEPGRKVEEIIDECNMHCLNEDDVHTYVSRTNGTMSSIDLAICSNTVANELEWRALDDNYTSDHHPILITYTQPSNPVNTERYKTNKADWSKYKELLTTSIPEYDETLDIEESYSIIKQSIIQAANESIPKTGKNNKRKEVPWWTKEIQELSDQKHKVSNIMTRTKKKLNKLLRRDNQNQGEMEKIIKLTTELKVIRPELNKLTAMFKRKVLIGKSESWKNYVSSINSRTPIKKVWRRIKKVSNAITQAPRHALNVNGQMVYETKERCNAIAAKLEKTSSDQSYEEEFIRHKNNQERIEITFSNQENVEDYNLPLTEEELHNALANSKNTAPGKDQINFEMIREMPTNAKQYMLKMFNQIWQDNVFPREWREAVVIPILKPGKDPSDPGNYRPISLTSCMCKTMEKIVNVRLTTELKERNAITPTQTGAERGRSTLEPLIEIEEYIRESFRQKQTTIAIFFDIEKAYDCTWKHQILERLQGIGINGQMGNFLKNFMKDRSFQVRIDNTYSETHTQRNGIPQGSVLSCTIFKIAINSIVKDLPRHIRNSLFMDDYCIYISARRLQQAERKLNLVLKKLYEWTKKTGFKFSYDKTKAVIFYKNKRWLKNHRIQLKLGAHTIPVVNQHKFLGIYFDSHLNFKSHITYIKGRSKRALNLIKKLSHTKWGADRSTLKNIYKATTRSIIDYGSEVYGSASKPTLALLDPVHHEGMRITTGAFRSSPTPSILVESGEPPLTLHREIKVMKTKLNLMKNNSPVNKLHNKADTYWKNDGSEDTAPYPIRVKRLFYEIDIEPKIPPPIDSPPLWVCKRAKFCFALIKIEKKYNVPQENRQLALKHINNKGRHYSIFTDGSKSEGKVGAAAVSTQESNRASLPNQASIFTAELWAIKLALNTISNTNFDTYTIYSDSKSALDAINRYEPTNHIIGDIIREIHEQQANYGKKINFCWVPSHVGIAGNEFADAAAKEAANEIPEDITLPPSDYRPVIKRAIKDKWQRMWEQVGNTNKLRGIKTTVEEWNSSKQVNRRTEVVMTRLRIGHTNITHKHLMTMPQEPLPTCERCGAHLSVKHIMKECPRTNRLRERYFGNKSLKEIIGEEKETSTTKVMKFLNEIELLNRI